MKTRAKIEILSYLCKFGLSKMFDRLYPCHNVGEDGFYLITDKEPPIESLVVISACSNSEYYLSWLKEIKEPCKKNCFKQYLLESVETGNLCWWYNVSIDYINPKCVKRFNSWKWTDKQFNFNDKWSRVSNKNYVSFCYYNGGVKFDKKSVILCIRECTYDKEKTHRYHEKKFDNWKKVTIKDMERFWNKTIKTKRKNK